MDVTRPVAKESVSKELPNAPKTVTSQSIDTGVEVPYTDYVAEHNHPLTVDYFELGDRWEDGYSDEVGTIETYLKNRVDKGDLANSPKAVKAELKELEKINNLKNEERTVIKVGILAAYAKFLLETEGIRYKVKKYGTR